MSPNQWVLSDRWKVPQMSEGRGFETRCRKMIFFSSIKLKLILRRSFVDNTWGVTYHIIIMESPQNKTLPCTEFQDFWGLVDSFPIRPLALWRHKMSQRMPFEIIRPTRVKRAILKEIIRALLTFRGIIFIIAAPCIFADLGKICCWTFLLPT